MLNLCWVIKISPHADQQMKGVQCIQLILRTRSCVLEIHEDAISNVELFLAPLLDRHCSILGVLQYREVRWLSQYEGNPGCQHDSDADERIDGKGIVVHHEIEYEDMLTDG